MNDFKQITHCYIDGDPIAYKGASSKEKVRYHFETIEEGVIIKSQVYPNAKEAANFLITQELMDNQEGWERIATKDVPRLQDVLDATDTVLKDYMNTAIRLTENPDLIFTIYLTGSGHKSKDIDGLEHMYQHNRDVNSRPFYLKESREHLITTYKNVKMCPKGFEADAIIMALTERRGLKGLSQFIDKDLRGMYDGHFIDMNVNPIEREILYCGGEVGTLYVVKSGSKEKIKGFGFVWEIFQAIAGDSADGYKGLSKYGEKKTYKLLCDCSTKEEIIKTAYELYLKVHPEGITYIPDKYPEDRPQKEQFRTAYQLLEQHINLAHQERSPTDYFRLSKWIGEDPQIDNWRK